MAHLSSGSGGAIRLNDRRAVVLLCPLAHLCHVADASKLNRFTVNGAKYPTVDSSHLIWIKQRMDPEYYDPVYIARMWNGNPPEPKRPPMFWLDRLQSNTGLFLE